MSFEEWSDCFIWRCDKCGHEVVFKPHDFWGCVAELKSRGWGFSREDGEDGYSWSHSCPRHRKTLAQVLAMPLKQTGR
jgi:hypothetical protein